MLRYSEEACNSAVKKLKHLQKDQLQAKIQEQRERQSKIALEAARRHEQEDMLENVVKRNRLALGLFASIILPTIIGAALVIHLFPSSVWYVISALGFLGLMCLVVSWLLSSRTR